MRVLGFVLIVVVLMVGIGSNLPVLLDLPSMLITFVGPLALLLFSGRRIGNMFGALFSGQATGEQLAEAADSWRLTGVYAMAWGGLGTIIGVVIMLKNVDDPAAVAPGTAICILTLFYGLLLAYAIATPLEARLRDRAAAAGA